MAPASGGIEVLADHIEILHQAAAQPIQRWLARKQRIVIGPAQPGIRSVGSRQQDLEGLVDPQNKRHALELIDVEPGAVGCLRQQWQYCAIG